jgi:hypothetical protein
MKINDEKKSTHEKGSIILFQNICWVAFSKQGFVTLIMAMKKVISQTDKIILNNLIGILKNQFNFDCDALPSHGVRPS